MKQIEAFIVFLEPSIVEVRLDVFFGVEVVYPEVVEPVVDEVDEVDVVVEETEVVDIGPVVVT